jgi:hypothetical protein
MEMSEVIEGTKGALVRRDEGKVVKPYNCLGLRYSCVRDGADGRARRPPTCSALEQAYS